MNIQPLFPAYVYYIENTITNQFYYGFRCDNISEPENDIWVKYFTSSKYVKALLSTYGKESFVVKVIFSLHDSEVCYWYEQLLIRENINNPLCLNKQYVDPDSNKKKFAFINRPPTERQLRLAKEKEEREKYFKETGKKYIYTEEGRALVKIRAKKTAKKLKDEGGFAFAKSRLGKTNTTEHNKRISEGRKGIIFSEDTKNKMSENHADVSGSNNPRAKKWVITSPDGVVYHIHGNMDAFAKEHHLHPGVLRGLGNGAKPPRRGPCVGWNVTLA